MDRWVPSINDVRRRNFLCKVRLGGVCCFRLRRPICWLWFLHTLGLWWWTVTTAAAAFSFAEEISKFRHKPFSLSFASVSIRLVITFFYEYIGWLGSIDCNRRRRRWGVDVNCVCWVRGTIAYRGLGRTIGRRWFLGCFWWSIGGNRSFRFGWSIRSRRLFGWSI